jgi:hypothetical protein
MGQQSIVNCVGNPLKQWFPNILLSHTPSIIQPPAAYQGQRTLKSSFLLSLEACHTHTHYIIHLLNIRMSGFLSQPGSCEVTKSSYRTRTQIIIINNFALYFAILHIKLYLFIENCE